MLSPLDTMDRQLQVRLGMPRHVSIAAVVAATFLVSLAAPAARADTSAAPAPQSVRPSPHKSRVAATALTIGGYLAGTGLMYAAISTDFEPALLVAGTAGMIALPSAGEWYAGQSGMGGMELRALAVVGTELALYSVWQDDGTDTDGLKSFFASSVKTVGIVFVGELVCGMGTVFSAVHANNAVRRFNEAHDLSLAPTVLRTPAGDHELGLILALRW
jgi:hypothetical protein